VYRSISSEAYTKEGLSPTLVIIDELHAFPTRELFDVLSLAQGARRDPPDARDHHGGVMSTRTEDESILYQLYQYGLRIIRGEIEDPRSSWPGGGHRGERPYRRACLEEANPGLDDIVDREDMPQRRAPHARVRVPHQAHEPVGRGRGLLAAGRDLGCLRRSRRTRRDAAHLRRHRHRAHE